MHEPTRLWLERYRRRVWITLLAGVLLATIGVVVAARTERRAAELAKVGISAQGEVVDSTTGVPFVEGWIDVAFQVDGVEHRQRVNLDSRSPHHDVGDLVTVLYDPSDPTNIRTTDDRNDDASDVLVFLFSLGLGFVAVVVDLATVQRSIRWRRMAAAAR